MKTLLFIDPVCPKPQVISDLSLGRMGGTEATCLRVCKALSTKFSIVLQQRGRSADFKDEYVRYSFQGKLESSPDFVVTLRDAKVFRQAKNDYPNAKHYLWMHDVVSGEYQTHMLECLGDGEIHNLLAVSQWHRAQIRTALPSIAHKLNIKVMYNPVIRYSKKDIQYNIHQLIFTSSPHKGLDQVLAAFQALRKQDPRFYLLVSNPGYYQDAIDLPEGVTSLTARKLSHELLLEEVQRSLCLFYPQTVFEETFGLVYGEANSVGTPIIGHNLGAYGEIIENSAQGVDCLNIENIIQTTLEWSKGRRPTVSANKLFSIEEVTKDWYKLFLFT